MKLKRYRQNLRVEDNKVYSYNTHVATIENSRLIRHGTTRWSKTTTKHMNYVEKELKNLKL